MLIYIYIYIYFEIPKFLECALLQRKLKNFISRNLKRDKNEGKLENLVSNQIPTN